MMSPAQDCSPPGPSLVTARHLRMTCAAHCWMPAIQPGAQEVLVAGVAVGDQVPGEACLQPGRDGALAAGGDGLQERQPPVRGPGDQHMRRPGRGLVFLSGSASSSSCAGARAAGTALSRTFTGVSSAASTSSAVRAAIIASSNPALPSCDDTRAAALSAQPAETGIPSSMPMTCAVRSGGTFP